MIIRHLPFYAVAAEEENLQRAANRLGVTQPALSRRIQDLENELGLLLFDRSSGRLKLTPMGRLLGKEARRIVDDVDHLTMRLRQQSSKGSTRFAVGLNERVIANVAISHALQTFRSDNPSIELNISIMSSDQQSIALREGRIDLAMLYLPRDQTQVQFREIAEDDPFVIAIPADHRLAAFGTLELTDLEGEDLIWPSSERIPLVYNELVATWRKNGIEPRITTEVYSGEAALHAVSAGLGIAVLRQSSTGLAPKGVLVRTIAELALNPVRVSVAWVERVDSAPRRKFLNLLSERNLIRL